MNFPQFLFSSFADAWLAAAVLLVLKATLCLLAAGTLAWVFRRASAAMRHLVWSVALGVLLALPMLSLLLPAWPLRMAALAEAPGVEDSIPFAPAALAVPAAERAPGVAEEISAARGVVAPVAMSDAPAGELSVRAGSPLAAIPATGWVFAVWLLGALAVATRLLFGLAGAWWLARRADPVADPAWSALLREAAEELELGRPVALLRSRRAAVPLACGVFRPVVVLPRNADGWTTERRRVVLLHELAHVRRHDCLTQRLAHLACALYWFHPGAWWAARRLRIEREHACDDQVIRAGTRTSDYAGHLLAVARSFRGFDLADGATVAMARPSHLEGRLHAILDPLRDRRAPSRETGLGTGLLACCLVLPLAAVQPGYRAAQSPSPRDLTLSSLPSTYFGVNGPLSAAQRSTQEKVIEKRVAAAPGQTLSLRLETGGDVRIVGWERDEVFVHAELGGRSWRDTRVEIENDASGVRVSSRQAGEEQSVSTSHEFEIRVPRRFNVEVRSNGGGIEIAGVQGRFAGRTNGGELELAELEGEANLATNGGDVTVSDSDLRGEVRTNGGDVRIRNTIGGLRGYTNGGNVTYAGSNANLPESGENPPESDPSGAGEVRAGELIRVRKAGGAITLASAPAGADVETGGGEIRITSAGGLVRARTGGGAITLGGVAGSVEASTGAGDVTVAVIGRGEREVEITSGTGDVVLTLPANFSGEFDVETAYTNNFGRRTRIVSDWNLNQHESAGWESGRGTPRKRVWVRERTGDGATRIRIRTVNGDIFLKRAGNRSGAERQWVWADPDPEVDPSVAPNCQGNRCAPRGSAPARSGFAYVTGDDGDERRRAVEALAAHAPPAAAAAALGRLAWEDGDPEVQREAVESLADLPGTIGLPELVRIGRTHPAEEARREAAEALGRKATDDAIAVLGEMIDRDSDSGVQREAVEALAATYERTDVRRRTDRNEILEMLEEVARTHPNRRVRAQAEEELEEIGVRVLEYVDLDREPILDDPAGERIPFAPTPAARVSDAALRGAPDVAVIRKLRQLAAHPKKHAADLVRERAAWALSRAQNGRVIEPLVDALGDPDWRIRAYAAWALGVAGDYRAVEPLAAALSDGAWRVRANAASALAELPDRRAVEELIAALKDAQWQVRAGAAEALGNIGDPRAASALRLAARDGHTAVRGVAEPALDKLEARSETRARAKS